MSSSGEIGVLGLARSGRAAAELALRLGHPVYASDAGDGPAVRQAADALRALGADVDTGGHDLERLARCYRIVLSPGIPPDAPVFRDAGVARVPRAAEVEFASEALTARVAAITGTNGKSTVTALAAHLLRAAGRRAEAAGNIGRALSEIALLQRQPEWVVVEVSSFQLADVERFAPEIGALTNLSPDHLDRYADVRSYYADKQRLFLNARPESRWVLNGEDDEVLALVGEAPGRRYLFRVESAPAEGEMGGHLSEDGWLVLRTEEGEERLLPAAELPLLGSHNRANALAAALIARLAGAGAVELAAGLRDFEGLPHRLQPVSESGGVLWVNDSKATNVGSAEVALRSMERPTLLLLGGKHKGESYATLLPAMHGRVRRVLAFGEAAPRIAEELEGRIDLEVVVGDFETVMARARALARPGDAVLLAPACSSYDMFRDFEERGERFTALAREAA
jgi:UDP-N-acetylmuramoylalanine--D-glutamate ligase